MLSERPREPLQCLKHSNIVIAANRLGTIEAIRPTYIYIHAVLIPKKVFRAQWSSGQCNGIGMGRRWFETAQAKFCFVANQLARAGRATAGGQCREDVASIPSPAPSNNVI